jgi:hypothetical protein
MSEVIKEFSEGEILQNKALFFESLFFMSHKESAVLKEQNTVLKEQNTGLNEQKLLLTEELESLKQIIRKKEIIRKKDCELEFYEFTDIQKKEKYEKSLSSVYQKSILDGKEESTVNLYENKINNKELVTTNSSRKRYINCNDGYNYNNNYNDNYNDNSPYNYNDFYNDNNFSNRTSPKFQKKYYRFGNSNEFLTDFYPNVRKKYIYVEEILINMLQNTNMKSGEIKYLFENKRMPNDIYLTLSCYDKDNNNTFIEDFWKNKNNENTNFAIIFNKRNPKFVLKLKGKGDSATFDKV